MPIDGTGDKFTLLQSLTMLLSPLQMATRLANTKKLAPIRTSMGRVQEVTTTIIMNFASRPHRAVGFLIGRHAEEWRYSGTH